MKNNNNNQKPKLNDYINGDKLRQLCLRYERELSLAKDYMFWFLLVWTLALLAVEWLNFLHIQEKIPEAMAAGYIILLGAYILHKEVGRWTGIDMKVRRGELFVYIWWATFLLMFFANIFKEEFEVPHNMPMLSYEVLGYFIFSEISKAVNTWQRAKKECK